MSCIVCGNLSSVELSSVIREGRCKVLKCDACGFIFLDSAGHVDYSHDYGSLTYDSSWSKKKSSIKRSVSLSRFNEVVLDLIKKKETALEEGCSVLEIGSGNGASVYGLNCRLKGLNIECVESNYEDANFIKKEYGVNVYSDLSFVNKKYDVIFGHHVFEQLC